MTRVYPKTTLLLKKQKQEKPKQDNKEVVDTDMVKVRSSSCRELSSLAEGQ